MSRSVRTSPDDPMLFSTFRNAASAQGRTPSTGRLPTRHAAHLTFALAILMGLAILSLLTAAPPSPWLHGAVAVP
jgi:hypothetical protein